jgi:hypothetical protein
MSLWAAGDDTPGSPDSLRTTRTDANGSFKFSGLAPGDYRIVAWEKIDPGMAQDPDFRKKFESAASAVKLREGSKENLEVKLIGADAIEVEAAKIR